jgi:hypothetical protein
MVMREFTACKQSNLSNHLEICKKTYPKLAGIAKTLKARRFLVKSLSLPQL